MIRGTVNQRIEAEIPIRLYGPKNHFEDVIAVIDTGYSGFLTVSDDIVKILGLDFFQRLPC